MNVLLQHFSCTTESTLVLLAVCKLSELHEKWTPKILGNSVTTPDYHSNQTNCLEQGTFRHTEIWSFVSGCTHKTNPCFRLPPLIRAESVHGECSCNHVLITHWPFDPGAALIPPHRPTLKCLGYRWLQLCMQLLQDDVKSKLRSMWVYLFQGFTFGSLWAAGEATPWAGTEALHYILSLSHHHSRCKLSGLQMDFCKLTKGACVLRQDWCFLIASSHIEVSKLHQRTTKAVMSKQLMPVWHV